MQPKSRRGKLSTGILLLAFTPLEVVVQRPVKVATHVTAVLDGSRQRIQVSFQVKPAS